MLIMIFALLCQEVLQSKANILIIWWPKVRHQNRASARSGKAQCDEFWQVGPDSRGATQINRSTQLKRSQDDPRAQFKSGSQVPNFYAKTPVKNNHIWCNRIHSTHFIGPNTIKCHSRGCRQHRWQLQACWTYRSAWDDSTSSSVAVTKTSRND